MSLLKREPRPSTRLSRGDVVLGNAQLVDTRPIKTRFADFSDIHQRYTEAQQKVADAEALENAERKHVEQLNGGQDKALAALSAALLLDGEPRRNLFGRFGPYGRGQLAALGVVDKVAAVGELVANLRRSMGLSEATLAAADQAEQAAALVKEALPAWHMRRAFVRTCRQKRDAIGSQWDIAYRALRHATLSAVEVPHLHKVLFSQKRAAKRIKAQTPESSNGATSEPTADVGSVTPNVQIAAGDLPSALPPAV